MRLLPLFLLLVGCSLDSGQVNALKRQCEEIGWIPMYVVNGAGKIVDIKCVPDETVAEVLESRGWYW